MIRRHAGLLAGVALLAACSSNASSRAPVTTDVTTTVALSSTTTSEAATSTTDPTSTTAPGPTADETAVVAAFAARAQALTDAGDVHAISVAIRYDDLALGAVALGQDTTGQPLATTAPFRLASISKVLLAATVLQLVEDGAIRLDDTLASQWTGPMPVTDGRVRDITVRQLLQHTSGIDKLRTTFFVDGGIDWREAADIALASPLLHDPATKYVYSNANFVILGRLVEQVTGSPVDVAIAMQVLRPLGIENARMNPDTHSFAPDGPSYVVGRRREYLEALGPAGAWEMSADQIATVLAGLQADSSHPLVSAESLQQMVAPLPVPEDEVFPSYGLGLMISPSFYGHTGTIEDVSAFAVDLPNGYTAVVLTASEDVGGGEGLVERFAAELALLAALSAR